MTDRPQILCIDDDPDLRRSVAAGLSECGFEVRCARDGPSGIASFERATPDLVLLDLGLPGMDGVSVCRMLKAISRDTFVPVIFLTAQSELTTKIRVLEEGGDDFCAKPFSLADLCVRIRVLLRIRQREQRLETESRRFQQFALTDPLTELGNRRAFDAALEREWARAQRSGAPLALVLADIDRFKAVNDRHGHATGDLVLRAVGLSIARAVRLGDGAFRIGGEEFAVLLPEASARGALAVAERVRKSVAAREVGELAVTISIGVAVSPDAAIRSREALYESADRALYEAKAGGRDRVVCAGVTVPS